MSAWRRSVGGVLVALLGACGTSPKERWDGAEPAAASSPTAPEPPGSFDPKQAGADPRVDGCQKKWLPDYVQMLDAVSGGRDRWAAAVVAGDKPCTSAFGAADEAKRLEAFVALAGKNATFGSICDGDLTAPLQKALATFDAACKGFTPVR